MRSKMKKENNCAYDFIKTVYHIKEPSKETIKKLNNLLKKSLK